MGKDVNENSEMRPLDDTERDGIIMAFHGLLESGYYNDSIVEAMSSPGHRMERTYRQILADRQFAAAPSSIGHQPLASAGAVNLENYLDEKRKGSVPMMEIRGHAYEVKADGFAFYLLDAVLSFLQLLVYCLSRPLVWYRGLRLKRARPRTRLGDFTRAESEALDAHSVFISFDEGGLPFEGYDDDEDDED